MITKGLIENFWTCQTSRTLVVLGGLCAGYVVGQMNSGESAVHADVRQTTTRSTFQAGSERSEAILREIAGTLKTIDGRMERVEKLLNRKDAPN